MSQPNEDRIDYRETADITEVHAAIAREHAEPQAGTMPIPTWLGVLSAAAICWAGVYVGMFHGGFNSSVYNEYESTPSAFFPIPGGGIKPPNPTDVPLVVLGAKIYKNNCAVCHQPTGVGQPGAVPPLAGSEWVDGSEASEKRLLAILLRGLNGPINVKGATYNSPAMQGFGAQMKPRELAGVLTYVRQEWGNKAGEVTEAQVLAAKKAFADKVGPYTEAEIKAIPTADALEAGTPVAAGAKPAAAPITEVKPAVAPEPGAAPAPAPASTETYDLVASIANGKNVYMQSCMACHQLTGAGVPGAFPPLIGTEYVTGDTRRLTAIVLKGIAGPLKVGNAVYATGMPNPSLTFPVLANDKNVADVLNYVRNNWGNKAEPIVTPDFVTKVRKEFEAKTDQWIEADLLNFPAAK